MSASTAWLLTAIIITATCAGLIAFGPESEKETRTPVIVFFIFVSIVFGIAALSIPVQIVMMIWSDVK